MIARLRRRHHRAWLALALVLAAIFLSAWPGLPPAPTRARLPPALLGKNPAP